ncbi:Stage V sporulation protein E [[Clostridium] ultunense Esp]|nr:Stage V sporulation protein E [[Clostridium] ultunense Esp]
MFIAMNLPYTFYKRLYALFGIGSLLFLFTVFIPGLGTVRNGARGWIDLGSMTIQPAEFAKVGLILYLAAMISKKGEKIRDFRRGFLPLIIMTALFAGVILLQNDFGTAALLLGTAVMVMFTGGVRVHHLMIFFLAAAPLLLIYIFTGDHRIRRFTSFLNPWQDPSDSGYHLIQSLYAIGHGRLFGVGLGQSIQKFHYLPYPQTDFIFSIIAEELGFIGILIFLLLYIGLLWRALLLSLKAKDLFANLVGVGVVSGIAIQVLINIGGVTGSIPITGVPLPLISYGGSSLLITLLSIGIVLSISREVSKTEREKSAKEGLLPHQRYNKA